MRRKTKVVLAASATLAVAATGFAVPATAGPAPSSADPECGKYARAWEHPEGRGERKVLCVGDNISDLEASGWDDVISSARNQQDRAIYFWDDPDYDGTAGCLPAGWHVQNLANDGLDNKISSVSWARGRTCDSDVDNIGEPIPD